MEREGLGKLICLERTVLILILCALVNSNFIGLPVNSSLGVIRVPDDYPSIQQAVDAAFPGDTILVANGTFFEHLVIEKPLTLVGANCGTIIDGYGSGTVVYISANYVNLTGFTVRNGSYVSSYAGIFLDDCCFVSVVGNVIRDDNGCSIFLRCSYGNNIIGNNITSNDYGIQLEDSYGNNIVENKISYNRYGIGLIDSKNNAIINNSISNCFEGIDLRFSSGNLVRNNKLSCNTLNFGVKGNSQVDFVNDVDDSNTVNYRPIYYWTNQHDKRVPNDAGYVAIINSTNITVSNLTLKNNLQGMLLAFANDCFIEGVDASWNDEGIELLYSNNNRIVRTNVASNYLRGIHTVESNYNTFESDVIESNYIYGLYLQRSNYSNIINNTITSNIHYGIALEDCSHNLMIDNIISANEMGLVLFRSVYNAIVRNKIESREWGIDLMLSQTASNSIQENTVQSNDCGIHVWGGVKNVFFHNNLVNNTQQVSQGEERNAWDNGFEGNYWSDYNGTDTDQNGVGDTPYMISDVSEDRYPLMKPYVMTSPLLKGDLNRDGKVDILDAITAGNVFGSCPGNPCYDINLDTDQNLIIDASDFASIVDNFGRAASANFS